MRSPVYAQRGFSKTPLPKSPIWGNQTPFGWGIGRAKGDRYLQRHILKGLGHPLVLAMDEVDRVFDTKFRNDFFGMLRSWHNNRAIYPSLDKLDLVLVTSTEPYQLIDDLNQSPFNVGQIIELEDFTPEQVAQLNARHNPYSNKL
ncbi:AAA-like domain-containing protein [Brasilonema sennae]|uniref:AAA-like domain-containing protein n=2 Tax=Brasilonema TaxID=383614 RepID=UPI00296E3151|nr:AAA-like domain-containing protein [Brasilonema sennae]